MKVAILICAHCRPEILKLTLGTWLEHYDESYDVEVFVSLHSNYSDYSKGLSEIEEMQNVRIVFVDEIEWNSNHVLRYSAMHAKALAVLMREALKSDCDYLAVLDHDLMFNKDFVKWCIEDYGDYDLVCGRRDGTIARTDMGNLRFAPKLTVWNMLMSRRMAVKALEERSVAPTIRGGIAYDTLALAYSKMDEWGLKVGILSEESVEDYVKHLWSLSFNFGIVSMLVNGKSMGQYREKVNKYVSIYNNRFPAGIGGLLGKLERREG